MTSAGRVRKAGWTLGAAASALVVVAACGGNGGSGYGSGSSSTAASSPTAAAAGSVTVMTKSGPLGTYLTDSSGRTLYLFTTDTSSTSTCYNACATAWPPLTASGTPSAGSGVTGGKLSTSPRTDGSTQVTYNNHPLYYYDKDAAPGDTKGQGVGGKWYVVSPAGDMITSSAGAATPSMGGGTQSGY